MVRDGSEWRDLADKSAPAPAAALPQARQPLRSQRQRRWPSASTVPSVSHGRRSSYCAASPLREAPVVGGAARPERIAAALELEAAGGREARSCGRKRFAWLKRQDHAGRRAGKLRESGSARVRVRGAAAVRGLSGGGRGAPLLPAAGARRPAAAFVGDRRQPARTGLELALDDRALGGQRELLRGPAGFARGACCFMDGIQDEQHARRATTQVFLIRSTRAYRTWPSKRAGARRADARGASAASVDGRSRRRRARTVAPANWPGYNPNDYRFSETAARGAACAWRGRSLRARLHRQDLFASAARAGERARCKPNEQHVLRERAAWQMDDVVIRDTHPSGAAARHAGAVDVLQHLRRGVGLEPWASTRSYEGFRRFGFAGRRLACRVPGEAGGRARTRADGPG